MRAPCCVSPRSAVDAAERADDKRELTDEVRRAGNARVEIDVVCDREFMAHWVAGSCVTNDR
jgi:hypothetical protein